MAWEDFLQPPGKVMRKGTRSPILAVCRTLEEQSEVPWNNDSLHSAIKGAEPGENSRRLNQLFLGSSKVLHMQSAGAAGTNCVLWEEKGELPWAQTWGTNKAGQRLPQLRIWVLEQRRCRWDTRQGHRVTFTPPHVQEQQGQCLTLRV